MYDILLIRTLIMYFMYYIVLLYYCVFHCFNLYCSVLWAPWRIYALYKNKVLLLLLLYAKYKLSMLSLQTPSFEIGSNTIIETRMRVKLRLCMSGKDQNLCVISILSMEIVFLIRYQVINILG